MSLTQSQMEIDDFAQFEPESRHSGEAFQAAIQCARGKRQGT